MPPTASLLGTAVGDAVGLPYEGLSRRRGVRLLGEPDRHRFLFGRGMMSDDGDHSVMVLQALCRHPRDPDAFARDLARRLRTWLLTLPAGVGFATLRAVLSSFVVGPARSGVFSAGNGPAMRAAVLGATIDDRSRLRAFVRAATTLTHTDPKAFEGALAVAVAARLSAAGVDDADAFRAAFRETLDAEPGAELSRLLEPAGCAESIEAFADRIGCIKGVSGYVLRTVPVAIHAWLTHPRDYRAAVSSVVRLGGDTDTVAAIVGGIVGAGVGEPGIPSEWAAGLWERRDAAWMGRLEAMASTSAANGVPQTPEEVGYVRSAARSVVFLAAVLSHVGRRVLPPY